jgi:ribosomal protein L28
MILFILYLKKFINYYLITQINMAKACDVCGRSSTKGASRSHSNIKTIKRQNINLQSKKIDGKKSDVCTKCIKTMAKVK